MGTFLWQAACSLLGQLSQGRCDTGEGWEISNQLLRKKPA